MKQALGIILIWLLGVSMASAASFQAGERISIDLADPEDVYAAGNSIDLDAPLDGDLIAGGQIITVDEEVSQDVIVAGETIEISAPVGDDVRAAGSRVVIEADVEGDVIVFGSSVLIEEGVTVGGDLIAYAGTVQVDGIVEGSLRTGAGQVILTGEIRGESWIQGEQVIVEGTLGDVTEIVAGDRIELVEGAAIEGDLRYWAPTEYSFTDNQVDGEVTYDEDLRDQTVSDNQWEAWEDSFLSGFLVLRLLWAAGVILVAMLLANRFFRRAAESVRTGSDVAAGLGWGAIGFFLTPMVIVALLISVIGIPVALFLGGLYIALVVFAGALGALFLSHLMNVRFQLDASRVRIYFMALGVFVILMVLGFVPFIAGLVWLGVTLLMIGSIARGVKQA